MQSVTRPSDISLGNQLIQRVRFLSLIAVISLILSIFIALLTAFLISERTLQVASLNAARTFDLFLSEIKSDLRVAADSLSHTQDDAAVLRNILARQYAVVELLLVEPDGRIIANRRRVGMVEAETLAEQPWLDTAASGVVYISPVMFEERVPFLVMAAPVNERGTLVSRVDLTTLWQTATDIQIGQSGYAYIVDGLGRLLVYRDLKIVKDGLTFPSFPRDGTEETHHLLGVNLRTGINNAPVISAEVPMAVVPWFAVVEQPVVEALHGFFYVLAILLIALIAVAVSVYSIVKFVRHRLVTRLINLRDNIDIIRQDDLQQRIVVDSENDEITQLAAAFNDLIARVESRTQALLVANAVAQKNSELKSQFVANMSHELRTPLNAVLGFTGILLDGIYGELDARVRRLLERIDNNGKRLLNLINDLLDLGKIETGRLGVRLVPVEIKPLVKQWIAYTEELARPKGINVEVEIDSALPRFMRTDPERLTQIAENLLSNAVKFTEQGKIKLTLETHTTVWKIHVADTGIGIPEQALNYIFEPFRQVDGSTTRRYGGTGLGLTIVHHLCQLLNGNITVKSAPGTGSIFSVSLPLAPVDEPLTVQPSK